MISEFQIQNYGCVKDATLKLTPLHALIGPNDSGKSTLLRALRDLLEGRVFQPKVMRSSETTGDYALKSATTANGCVLRVVGQSPDGKADSVRLVRFDVEQLKQRSSLLDTRTVDVFPSDRGSEIAGIYDAILNRGDDTFARINQSVRELFPSVVNIRLPVQNGQKTLGAKLKNGQEVGAQEMSEGLLLYLAYAALCEVCKAGVVLVEEPENGLHPARVAEVIGMLRELTKRGIQVILTTHSPLVINELQPDEVSIVTRTEAEGTKVTPIAATPNFAERAKVYALGELWLSYANGKDEAPLLNGGAA